MNKNVLLVSYYYPPDFTGAGLRLHRTYKRLVEKYSIKFMVLAGVRECRPGKDIYDSVKIYRVNNVTVQFKKYSGVTMLVLALIAGIQKGVLFFKVAQFILLNNKKFEVIHIGMSTGCLVLFSVFFGKILKKKIIIETVLNDDPASLLETKPGFIKKNIYFSIYKVSTHIIVSSPKMKKSYQCSGIDIRKIWLKPNPVDNSIYYSVDENKKHSIREKLGLPLEKKIIISVGRLCPRKNQLFIAKSLKYIRTPFFWAILGPLMEEDRLYYKKILKVISSAGLENRVFINQGICKNVNEFMQAGDLFVHSSLNEAGPTNVLLEAWMSGLPAVVLDIPDIYSFVFKKELESILVDNSASPREFGARIDEILSREVNRFHIAESAKKYFDYKKIDRIYYKMITNKDIFNVNRISY